MESWTVASSASFPAATTGAGTQFRIVEDDPTKQSEIILVTNVSGTTWTVTRGAEGTTPVAHTAGFTVVQTVTAAVLAQFVDTASAQTIAGLKTFTTGITMPSGAPLITGTRSVYTGTRATTTNASDTVDLGTFVTTGGAMELRIHAQLAAPAAGTTASVTKVYEVATTALMGTASTWYLCLPTDTSANAAATNDFALEVNRTATNTFQFRFRQKTIGVAGAITFTVESLGDTAVTFTPSTTVTAAPAAVSTPHPSNAFTAAAGQVGIGTDSPAALLDVRGTLAVSGTATFSASPQVLVSNPTWTLSDGTFTAATALASAGGAFHSAALGGDIVVRGNNAANTQGVVLAAGPSSTGYLRVASGSVTFGGFFQGTGNVQSTAGAVIAGVAGTIGWTQMQPGTTGQAGYIAFYQPNQTRAGYIGWANNAAATTDTGAISYQAGSHLFYSSNATGSTIVLNADGTAGRGAEIALVDTKAGQTTPAKYIRALGGILQVLNNAYTTAILALTDAGALTVPSSVTAGAGTAAVSVFINAAPTSAGQLDFQTNGSSRWRIAKNGTAETGSNVGSDLQIKGMDDTGTLISNYVTITRSTGVVTIPSSLTVTHSAAASLFSSAAASNIGPISVAYNGATPDNNSYGIVGVTAAAGANQAYYSMTAAGNAVFGMGMGTDNTLRIGAISTGKTMGSTVVKIDGAGTILTPSGINLLDSYTGLFNGAGLRPLLYGYYAVEVKGGRVSATVPSLTTGASGDPSLIVYTPTSSQVGLVVRGSASQSTDLQQWQNSTPSTMARIDQNGGFFGSFFSVTSTSTIQPTTDVVNLALKARTTANGGQTQSLLSLTDPSGNTWASFDANGNFGSLVNVTAATMQVGNGLGSAGTFVLNVPAAATAGVNLQPSTPASFRTAYWTGIANAYEDITLTGIHGSTFAGDAFLRYSHAASFSNITQAPTTGSTEAAIYSVGGRMKIKDGAGNVANADGPISPFFRSSSVSNSTSTLATTGMTVALQPGTYEVICNGSYNTSVTTAGIQFAYTFTGTLTSSTLNAMIATSATTSNAGSVPTTGTKVPSAAAVGPGSGVTMPFQLTGHLVVSAAGTYTLQFAAGGSGTVTVNLGSYLKVSRIA